MIFHVCREKALRNGLLEGAHCAGVFGHLFGSCFCWPVIYALHRQSVAVVNLCFERDVLKDPLQIHVACIH